MPVNEISTSLSAELCIARELVLVLEREQTAITEADLLAIEALTEKKAEIIRKLAQLAERRRQALAARGFVPGNEGIQGGEDCSRSENAAWYELRQIVEKAQKINQTNHRLIHMRLGYTEAALMALQGAAAATLPIYSPDGRRRASFADRARILARL
jgi:flagellar biosynthesis/type III secretory pathway chaperone